MSKLIENFCEELYLETECIRASVKANIVVRDVFFLFFAKARTLLKSIVILSREKQFPTIPILLRSLLENYIQIKWIDENDTVGLTKRYADLSNVIRMRAYFRTLPDWQQCVSTSQDQQFLQRFHLNTSIAKQYGYANIIEVRDWRPPTSKGKRITIADMARLTDLVYDYNVVYNRLCETTHGGPGSDLDYEVIPQGQGLVPHESLEPTQLVCAASYFLNIYALTNKAMGQSYKEVTYQKLKYERIIEQIFAGAR